ncbi:hypothetical protein C8J41_10621 [Sphingomonas sp. PP-CC-3G-468]|nr:hypothetical protein C8J41_10621 [Sphingomonas sp. PP-CC-3G-468]
MFAASITKRRNKDPPNWFWGSLSILKIGDVARIKIILLTFRALLHRNDFQRSDKRSHQSVSEQALREFASHRSDVVAAQGDRQIG